MKQSSLLIILFLPLKYHQFSRCVNVGSEQSTQLNSEPPLAGCSSVFDSVLRTDIHHGCAVMSCSRVDQYNPIRHRVSLGSKAFSDLRNLTTRQYVHTEPSCSSDSSIPSFDTVPTPLPEYQQPSHCYSNQFQSKASGQSLSSGGHTEPADERGGR